MNCNIDINHIQDLEQMTEIEQVGLKHIKICLLGSQKVGKTCLAHKLVDLNYEEYRPASECQKFIKQLSEKKQILIYYDFPPIHNNLVEELTRDHIFDVMVCLFKDSTSFGQLYEFFQQISKKTEENNSKFNDYWESIKNIILVYSDFDDKGQIQLQQLFNILSEEIRNFNRTASIKQFVLKPQLTNHQYLRYLIEKNRFQEHFSDELIPSSRKIVNNNAEKVSGMITEVTSFHNLDAQQEQQMKRDGGSRSEDEGEQIPGLAQIKLTSTKEKLLDSQESIEQLDNIQTLRSREKDSYEKQAELIENKISKQALQASPQIGHNSQNEANPKVQVGDKIGVEQKVEKQVVIEEQDREKQHFRQVFNRLIEKINNQQIEQSKKTSYQDLFEEFRRTSKDESKITKELKQYWQQKIEKLEEEDEQDEEQEGAKEEEDQDEEVSPSKQEKPHPHSAENRHIKKHGEPLKPQSNYLEDRMPKRQRSTSDTKPCFCELM